MHTLKIALSPHAARMTAIVLIVILGGLTRLPQLAADEADQLAARFGFTSAPLPELAKDPALRSDRDVHPDLDHISAWISSVGASVALNDLDGDGLSNDLCYVDPRTNQVIVAPIPDSEYQGNARFDAFALDSAPIAYDESTMAPMGCLPNDMNEDGRMDLLVYYWGRTPVAFLQMHFTETRREGAEMHRGLQESAFYPREVVAPSSGEPERWFTNAATFTDLDGDGHADLILGNYFQDGARILDANTTEPTYMQHSMSRAYNGGRNRIFLWEDAAQGRAPSIRFAEAVGALSDEVAHGWTLAMGAADLDGDLLPELYFANDFGTDRFFHNRSQPGKLHLVPLTGQRGFTTPASKVLGHDSFKGMGTDFGDINGDGLLDIYVSNIAAEYALEESHFLFVNTGNLEQMQHGTAPFVERSEALGLARSGWGWEAKLADFDNDGTLEAIQATGFVRGTINRWPELHELAMGNDELLRFPAVWPNFQAGTDLSGDQHNPFFVQAADGRYYDIAGALGLDQPQVSRGMATADVDGDGDLDFAVANQWEPSHFYRNDCPSCGAFLGLHLRLSASTSGQNETVVYAGHPKNVSPTRPAIGATATVRLKDGKQLIAQVDGGNGHSGARSPELHFGLGHLKADTLLDVQLAWRDGSGNLHEKNVTLAPGWHTVVLRQR